MWDAEHLRGEIADEMAALGGAIVPDPFHPAWFAWASWRRAQHAEHQREYDARIRLDPVRREKRRAWARAWTAARRRTHPPPLAPLTASQWRALRAAASPAGASHLTGALTSSVLWSLTRRGFVRVALVAQPLGGNVTLFFITAAGRAALTGGDRRG